MSRQSIIAYSNRRWVKVTSLVILSGVFIVFLIQTYGKAYRDIGYDFTSYLLAAQAIFNGENPFTTDTVFTYCYPMFFAFVLIPLSLLPYWLSNFLWYLINLVSLFGSIIILIKLSSKNLMTSWGTHLYAPLTVALLLMTAVIQNHFLNGQVNFLVLLLCVLFLKYDYEKKTILAALFLALAAAIKLVPLIFFLFLFLRGKFKILFLSTSLFVVFCLLPYISLGETMFDIYGDYIGGFIYGKFSGNQLDHPMYFTLHGFLKQTIAVFLDIPKLKIVSTGIVVLSLAVVDFISIRRNGKNNYLWACHLYFIAILFISPLSETHHLAFIIPVFLLLILKLLYNTSHSILRESIPLIAYVTCFYFGKTFDGPFFFIGLLILFLKVTHLTLRSNKPVS